MPACNFEDVLESPALRAGAKREWELGRSRVLREGTDATLIAYGALVQNALLAAQELESEGVSVEVIDARFCKPLDADMLERVLRAGRPVLTVEDHALQNGFGSAVVEHAVAHQLPTDRITRLGMPDRLVAHASRTQQLAEVGLDPSGIAKSVRDAFRAVNNAAVEASI